MSKENIIRKAFEVGQMIADSEEKQAMEAMQARIKSDPEAYDLLARVQSMRADLEGKRSKGFILDDNDQRLMAKMQEELNQNQLIQAFGALKEEYDNLMSAVFFTISQTARDGNKSNCGDCDPSVSNCSTCTGLN